MSIDIDVNAIDHKLLERFINDLTPREMDLWANVVVGGESLRSAAQRLDLSSSRVGQLVWRIKRKGRDVVWRHNTEMRVRRSWMEMK